MTIQTKNLLFKNDTLYDGYVSESKAVCRFKNGVLYRGSMTFSSNAVALVKDGKIYEGNMVTPSRQKGFVKNGMVYRGTVASGSAVVLTEKNGEFFEGNRVQNSTKIDRIKGTEMLDLSWVAAMIHFFVCPILTR